MLNPPGSRLGLESSKSRVRLVFRFVRGMGGCMILYKIIVNYLNSPLLIL